MQAGRKYMSPYRTDWVLPGEHQPMSCTAPQLLLDTLTFPQAPLTKALRTYLFYNTTPGRILMRLPPTWWLLSLEHKRMAAHANSPDSKEEIPSFLKVGIQMLQFKSSLAQTDQAMHFASLV